MMETPVHLLAYCERAGDPGLWAEPLNFITNLVFIIYGYLAIRTLNGTSWRREGDLWALAISMILIGLGSGLWHSWALPGWTVMVDTIPIYLFINIYIFSLYRRIAHWRWYSIFALWAVFTALSTSVQMALPMDTLNGSLMYLPTLGFMLLSAAYFQLAGKRGARCMFLLSLLFLISLTFRTLDDTLCTAFPIGTHFIWHCLNGILLYHLLLLLTAKPAAAQKA